MGYAIDFTRGLGRFTLQYVVRMITVPRENKEQSKRIPVRYTLYEITEYYVQQSYGSTSVCTKYKIT